MAIITPIRQNVPDEDNAKQHKIITYLQMHTGACRVKQGLDAVFVCYVEGQKMFSEISALKLQEICTTAILGHFTCNCLSNSAL